MMIDMEQEHMTGMIDMEQETEDMWHMMRLTLPHTPVHMWKWLHHTPVSIWVWEVGIYSSRDPVQTRMGPCNSLLTVVVLELDSNDNIRSLGRQTHGYGHVGIRLAIGSKGTTVSRRGQ